MIYVDQAERPAPGSLVDPTNKCLAGRACETACPSGVEYGKLVEHARSRVEREYPRSWIARVTRDFVFRILLLSPLHLAAAAGLLRRYQRPGLQAMARGIGVLKLLGMAERERLLPRIDDDFFFSRFGQTFPAAGPRRARVAFFAGCVANVTFSQLNEATVRVLTANGCEVVVPDGQLCCGALAAHAGVRDVARGLARNNLSVFHRENFDAIITNADGCGATLKEYDRLSQSWWTVTTSRRRRPPPHRPRNPPRRRTFGPGAIMNHRSPSAAHFFTSLLPCFFAFSLQKRLRPSRGDEGIRGKGVSSSGEQVVLTPSRLPTTILKLHSPSHP